MDNVTLPNKILIDSQIQTFSVLNDFFKIKHTPIFFLHCTIYTIKIKFIMMNKVDLPWSCVLLWKLIIPERIIYIPYLNI